MCNPSPVPSASFLSFTEMFIIKELCMPFCFSSSMNKIELSNKELSSKIMGLGSDT